jgi:hypothetical protein
MMSPDDDGKAQAKDITGQCGTSQAPLSRRPYGGERRRAL